MNIKEILDKLDSKIFPEEIKNELVESFTEAVNTKVAEVTTKLETEAIDKEIALEKKYTGKIEKFYESERSHIAEYMTELKEEIQLKLVTKYADEVLVEDALAMYRKMQNFLGESVAKLNVKPEQIDESIKLESDVKSLETKLEKTNKEFNEFKRFALIKEHHDTITSKSLQEQFHKLAEEIEFNGDVELFNRKLSRVKSNIIDEYKNIVESVKKEVVPEVKVTKPTQIKESVDQKKKEDKLAMIKEMAKNRINKGGLKVDMIVESNISTEQSFDDISMYN